ncbi:MAG: 2'-deoxycytidine 5'-triphosphate deaminase [Nanoarchaeota archaeon]|nr:2'-deoxycytidine 5'-triphosphate deaminase [Nanoarchaeota archaeon]
MSIPRIEEDIRRIFPYPGILSDRGMRREIRNGNITISDFKDSQLQPSSLDLRIGKVHLFDEAYRREEARRLARLPSEEIIRYEPSDNPSIIFKDVEDSPIDLPPRSFAQIFFHENIKSNFPTRIDLRSSRGRLGLEILSSDNESVSVFNHNPNIIRLYGRTSFAQMFFTPSNAIDGYVVHNIDEAERIGRALRIPTTGPYAVLSLGDHAYRFKHTGLTDTRNLKDTDCEKLSTKNLAIPINETTICQLSPRIDLPADIGIQILHNIPFIQNPGHYHPDPSHFLMEGHVCNAGWVDPGYKGNLTAHIRRTKTPGEYTKGEPLALGVFFKYHEPVERPYSPDRNHYYASDGTTARD